MVYATIATRADKSKTLVRVLSETDILEETMNQRTDRVELTAHKRTVLGSHVKQLRRQGWVPGVMYGRDFAPQSLQFEERALRKILSQVGGSQLININIEGQEEPEYTLLREVQRNVINGALLHVDFYRVMMTESITTEVPLLIAGESSLVEQQEGILLHGISEVEVECLPGDLVDAIEVDLSELTEIGQAILVSDLAIPAGIKVLTDSDEMIARIVPAKRMEIEEEEEELVVMEEGQEIEAIEET
jgi:large subunit ribosomal protein L25